MSRIIEPQHYYPKIAEAAREIMGRSSRVMRAVKQQDLIAERKKSKTYRPDRKS